MPERHLGLVQAVEHPELDRLIGDYAAFLAAHVDLEAVRAAAYARPVTPASGTLPPPPAQRIALAPDADVSFVCAHHLAGCRTRWTELLR